MGIISLNEKRTVGNPTHTTGKEKSYFTSDQFLEPLADPKITGKYHYHGDGRLGFGAFWESATGDISNLAFNSLANPTFTSLERTSETHADETTAWSSFELNLTDKPNGRPVFYIRLTTESGDLKTWRNDLAFDDISLVTREETTVSFDPSTSSIRSNGTWKATQPGDADASSYTQAKSNYDPNDLETVTDTYANAKWIYDNDEGGASTHTGPDNAADNNDSTYYVYFESSAAEEGSVFYLTWKDFYNLTTGAAI